jgi:hypothetical protein
MFNFFILIAMLVQPPAAQHRPQLGLGHEIGSLEARVRQLDKADVELLERVARLEDRIRQLEQQADHCPPTPAAQPVPAPKPAPTAPAVTYEWRADPSTPGVMLYGYQDGPVFRYIWWTYRSPVSCKKP